MTRVVTGAGALDLDHLGPEIGEQLGAPGTRKHAAEVEDLDPVERLQWRRPQKRRSASTGVSGIVPRRTGDTAARMRARAAQIETFQRHPVIGRANHRTSAEQLIKPHLAVEDVAADQSEAALEIERGMDLPADHRLCEARAHEHRQSR